MECGSTSVKMSDGTVITRIREMKDYIKSHGIDLKKIPKDVQLLPPLTPTVMMNEEAFARRWAHIPQVFIREVDGSDSAITDEGFLYFTECRQVKKMKFNHCDYFTDEAIKLLSIGRPSKTLEDMVRLILWTTYLTLFFQEICLNPWLSDRMVTWLLKMKSLKRLHFYFLPYVANRPAVLRQLRVQLPRCKSTFPEIDKIGYGYE